MNWDDLTVFLALMRQGSLSGAAREIGVEHATVARRVDRLERALALKLFDRLPRGWHPTAEARALLPEAEEMERAAQSFARRARGADAGGPVRISAPPQFQAQILVPLLPNLRAAHPDLSIRLDGLAARSNLQSGEIDLALRVGAPEGQTLRARKLAEVAYRPYRADGVATEAVIRPEKSAGEVFAWARDWAEDRAVALYTGDVPSMLAAARAGLGIAVLPVFLARPAGLLPVGNAVLTRPLYLVLHEDKARSPRIRRMAEALADALRGIRSELV
ncbi:LysR family transcriptional regulator [Salipiger sp. P9]|uniref:LysR family transcriptional regulator n=1 Tax=Salipiger pentaromativorans TaxID=2943193 RepID=UPI00215723B7|nr:LysR family transcriptional regulator [Salipiger pentaromativorans]MCR8546305.1 LysR family transcriptional regulator [Salipiger pentaromativorans]